MSATRQGFGVWCSSSGVVRPNIWAGVASSASQMAVRVVKRMARALLVFRIERFAIVMPVRRDSSVNVTWRSARTSSR